MRDFSVITAPMILAIPEDEPERLFSEPDSVTDEFRAAARQLHPDKPSGDADAFARLNALHRAAQDKIKNGVWLTPGRLEIRGTDGKTRIIRYRKDFDAGVGRGYLGRTLLTYVLPIELADLANDARLTLDKIAAASYPSARIKHDLQHREPRLKHVFHTQDGRSVLVLDKPETVFRLRDVLDHWGGRLDPLHVAWIMSEMHHLTCWLDFLQLTHNDLSLDSVFICPAQHTAMVLGGWWFAVPAGARMQRVQQSRTLNNAPRGVLDSKQASIRTDLSLIRLLGRELLGDESGASLASDARVPPALANWLRIATTGDAREDYRLWQDTLTAAFGERRFTKLDLDFSTIYHDL
jgi:hypothetical protein